MKKVTSVLAATMLAGGLTTSALATEAHDHGGAVGTGSAAVTTAPRSGELPAGGAPGRGGAADLHSAAHHLMTGTIEAIDHEAGTLTLHTITGKRMTLQFPPDMIQDYHAGDRVAVRLGLVKQTGVAGTPAGPTGARAESACSPPNGSVGANE